MRHFVQSAGVSYKPNFRKCNSTGQRSTGKGKWLTRVDDQGGYEAPLRMAIDNAALQRKGKGKGKSEGKEGKGLGKRSKGWKGEKGARLPLTDLVPEPDPEQKFIMVGGSEKTHQDRF